MPLKSRCPGIDTRSRATRARLSGGGEAPAPVAAQVLGIRQSAAGRCATAPSRDRTAGGRIVGHSPLSSSAVNALRLARRAKARARRMNREPVDIVAGVVAVSCAASPWNRQDTHLLVVANGFCRDAGSACKLTNRQRSFHSLSSLCDVSGKKGTHSTSWKVKSGTQKKLPKRATAT